MNTFCLYVSALACLILIHPPAQAAGISGQLKTTADSYPERVGPPTEDLIPYVSFELAAKHRLTRRLRFQWRLTALSNLTADGPPEKFYADLPEGYLEYKRSDFKFRLGTNTFNWGMVDIMSPSDSLNTTALFHPLRSLKQGAPAAEILYGPETFNIDLVYIPWQRRPLMPSKNSRWLPRRFLLTSVGAERLRLPDPIEYVYDSPDTQNHALNNNYGAKLASHVGSVDMQLTYTEGAAPMPKMKPYPEVFFDNTTQELYTASPLHIQSVTYRERNAGAGIAWALENLIFRA
jgi:hypothetical protein